MTPICFAAVVNARARIVRALGLRLLFGDPKEVFDGSNPLLDL